MKNSQNSLRAEIQATRAFLKFCIDHQHGGTMDIGHIQDCLHAMESNDVESAIKSYKSIRFGPYLFDDWWPPAIFEHENGEYVAVVFQALLGHWHELMKLLCKKNGMS